MLLLSWLPFPLDLGEIWLPCLLYWLWMLDHEGPLDWRSRYQKEPPIPYHCMLKLTALEPRRADVPSLKVLRLVKEFLLMPSVYWVAQPDL